MHTAFSPPIASNGRHAVAAMPAEIDIHNRDGLVKSMFDVLDSKAGVLVVDMSETAFCDSSGVHALLTARRRALSRGKTIRVVAPQRSVRRVLEICGIGRLMPIDGSLEEALSHRPPMPG
ncbi:STAS domain-containing protein [Streptomonospora wellingtoniae]|uniref:Anti-sigma factor antagonist n=1 Tax=Streptomonospora wellingtoniae TaxID=3075544 RepID=A0ABU2KRP7_9ACTN|nr:STAS domain-containing protein [Streptomonospora sp. DSM 45055]MDT0301949.1 STAS domain-containing protein [Streptomonospora sp. DSM 45055]